MNINEQYVDFLFTVVKDSFPTASKEILAATTVFINTVLENPKYLTKEQWVKNNTLDTNDVIVDTYFTHNRQNFTCPPQPLSLIPKPVLQYSAEDFTAPMPDKPKIF